MAKKKINITEEQYIRYYNAKDNIYKELYLSDINHANIGILNLISLADRTEQERQEIALKGNKESVKARRIKKGIRLAKEYMQYYTEYNKEYNKVINKYKNDNDILTIKDNNKIDALNRRYERKENKFNEIEKQLKDLYNIDIIEKLKEHLEIEQSITNTMMKQYKKIKGA